MGIGFQQVDKNCSTVTRDVGLANEDSVAILSSIEGYRN